MKKECKACRKAVPSGTSGHEWECTAEEYDIDNLTCFEPREEASKANGSESLDELIGNQIEQPVVSYFVHEADMMQKDADNERLHETMKEITKNQHKAYIFIIVFLVLMFTIRMWKWNNTIVEINKSLVEVATMHYAEAYHAENADTP